MMSAGPHPSGDPELVELDAGTAGEVEWVACVLFLLATVFLWWHGLRAFTLAGAALFIAAVLGLGMHRRQLLRAHGERERWMRHALWRCTPLIASLLPGLALLRWLGVGAPLDPSADRDLWIGGMLYVLGVLELVEVATLRLLHDPRASDEPG
jgi:hypothetical protein